MLLLLSCCFKECFCLFIKNMPSLTFFKVIRLTLIASVVFCHIDIPLPLFLWILFLALSPSLELSSSYLGVPIIQGIPCMKFSMFLFPFHRMNGIDMSSRLADFSFASSNMLVTSFSEFLIQWCHFTLFYFLLSVIIWLRYIFYSYIFVVFEVGKHMQETLV